MDTHGPSNLKQFILLYQCFESIFSYQHKTFITQKRRLFVYKATIFINLVLFFTYYHCIIYPKEGEFLIFCRKILFFGFFIFLCFSFSPNLSFATGVSTTDTNVPDQYVKITEDTDIHSTDQQIVGVLHAGTQVGVQNNQDGKIYFQWDGSSAYVDDSNPVLGSGSDSLSFSWVDSGNSGTGNRFKTHKSVDVYSNTDLNNPILTLNPNVEYPITQTNGEYYEITIGQRTGLVKATDVELISENSNIQNTSNTAQTAGTNQSATSNSQSAGTNQSATSNSQTNTSSSTGNSSATGTFSTSENSTSAAPFSSIDGYFKVTSDEVAIYNNSSDSSKLLGYLFKDQVYKKIADNGDWYQIKFGDRLGYIRKGSTVQADGTTLKNLNLGQSNSGQYFTSNTTITVYDNSSGSLVPFANLAQGVQYPFISELGDWLLVDVAGRIGYVYKPVTSKGFLPSDRYFQVNLDNVSVYDNSSGSLKFVGTLVKGQIFSRISGGDWQQIKFGNGYGYVWADSTAPASGNTLKNVDPGMSNSGRTFTANTTLTVYDNSSGSLVPFTNLAQGVQYPYISDTGDWLLVDVAGRLGYVYKAATTIGFLPSDQYFQVNQDNVSIYDNSSGSLKFVGTLVKGQIFPRVSGGDWQQIKFGNGYGYVWAAATVPTTGNTLKDLNSGMSNSARTFTPNTTITVYDNSNGSLVPFVNLVKGVPYTMISDTGDWLLVDVAGRLGYVYKAATTEAFLPSDRYFQVNQDSVTVYDNRSGSLQVVGHLAKGEIYPRIADYGSDWHQIKFGNGYGYVWKASTSPANGNAIKDLNMNLQNSNILIKPNQDIAVYDNTSGSLVPFASLVQGKPYPVISNYGSDWYEVDVSGRIGYIYKAGTTRVFSPSDKYFQVTDQNIPVYDNSTGALVVVGYLNSGQVYPRVSDFGDLHQIKFGNRYGYVYKTSTVPADNSTLKNEDTSPNSNNLTFKALQNLTVYDNTSGSLVPFGVINQGDLYPAICKVGTGDWLKIDFSGRIGYVYAGAVQITSGGLIADLSKWQGSVDFSQLAKVVDGVVLRVQGGDPNIDSKYLDPKYQEYVAGSKANNIPFGTYAYFNASDTAHAIAEAQSAYQLMDKSSQFFAVDIEQLTGADLVSAGQAYIDYLKQQGVAKVGLYSGDNFFAANNLGAIKCDFYWIARYGPNNGAQNAYPSSPNDLWQFTSVGTLPGIQGNVDESTATGKQLSYFTGSSLTFY
jgi:GH25 family lysozyme M1 (1,4-beta-N-acetylmuramidase)/SH3-like domain-containing protein